MTVAAIIEQRGRFLLVEEETPEAFATLTAECTMPVPTIAQKAPYAADVEAGKSYWWCACGGSKNQPFCDGTHKGSIFSPLEYKAAASATVYFCGCKHSAHAPLCDGTHKTL